MKRVQDNLKDHENASPYKDMNGTDLLCINKSFQPSPYPIGVSHFETLTAIGKTLPLDGYYIQTKDIYADDQNEQDLPIGSPDQPFRGQYHGNGFKIINVHITSSRAALFDTVENAVLENIVLENAVLKGTGSDIKIAPLAIDVKGTSQIEHIKWSSGSITLEWENLKKAEIAGLVHTLSSGSVLTQSESQGEILIHEPQKKKLAIEDIILWKGQVPRTEVCIAGIVFYNQGVIHHIVRGKKTEGPSVCGVSKCNAGTIYHVTLHDIIGEHFASGIVESNQKPLGCIDHIKVGQVCSQQDAAGVFSINQGTLQNIQIQQVTSQSRAMGVGWRNYGVTEGVEIGKVQSQKKAFGIVVLNHGTLRHLQIGNVISESNEAYALVSENGLSGTIEMCTIGNLNDLQTSFNKIIAKNLNCIRFIYLNLNQQNSSLLSSLFTNPTHKISPLFLENHSFHLDSTEDCVSVNIKNQAEYKHTFFEKKWDLFSKEAPDAKWLWSSQGPKLKTPSAYRLYQAFELLFIFRTFLGQYIEQPGFYNFKKNIPLDLMILIAQHLFKALSSEDAGHVITHALNKETLVDPEHWPKSKFF